MLNRSFHRKLSAGSNRYRKAFYVCLYVLSIFLLTGCGANRANSRRETVDVAQERPTVVVLGMLSTPAKQNAPETVSYLPTPTISPLPTPTPTPVLSEMTAVQYDDYLWGLFDKIMGDFWDHVVYLQDNGKYYGDNDRMPPWLESYPEEVAKERRRAETEEVVDTGYDLAYRLENLPDYPCALYRYHFEIMDALSGSSDAIDDGVAIHSWTEELYYYAVLYDAIRNGDIIYNDSSEDTYYEVQQILAGDTPTSQSRALQISEVNKPAEYVVIENIGRQTIDLECWIILSERGMQEWRVPTNFVLNPGEQVTIYSGEGEKTATEMYSGFPSAIWNNDEVDPAVLLDPYRNEISRR